MKVRVYCEKCETGIDLREGAFAGPATCVACGATHALAPDAELLAGRPPRQCASCGHDLFHLRKQFPPRLGLGIVLIASVLTFTPIVPPSLFFLPLIIASLIDLGLYFVLPWKQVCYVCDTEYSGAVRADLAPYDLHVATDAQKLRRRKKVVR